MTRQIALGAVISFAVTVLVLSVWQPSKPLLEQPTGAKPPPAAPAPAPALQESPAVLKPVLLDTAALARPVRLRAAAEADAGAP